jgi:pSer/pThr/pTyr-binding forkhead associated (FHA) protein
MQVVLAMFKCDGERRSFSVVREMTVIGRREDCDLRIPVGDVSRKHCRLVMEEESIRIEDLGSSNGTYVNSQRVQEAVLQPGDRIQVGPVQFIIQIDGEPPEDQMHLPVDAPADASADTGTPPSADGVTQAGSVPSDSSLGGVLEEVPLEEGASEGEPATEDNWMEIGDENAAEDSDMDIQVDLDGSGHELPEGKQ